MNELIDMGEKIEAVFKESERQLEIMQKANRSLQLFKPAGESYIYCYYSKYNNLYKVGVTRDLEARHTALNNIAKEILEEVLVIPVNSSIAYKIEKTIHKELKNIQFKGEWYLTDDRQNIIDTMIIISDTITVENPWIWDMPKFNISIDKAFSPDGSDWYRQMSFSKDVVKYTNDIINASKETYLTDSKGTRSYYDLYFKKEEKE